MKTIITSGKRKRAIARASLVDGKGVVRLNNQLLEFYGNHVVKLRVSEPLLLVGDVAKQVNIDIRVTGGGVSGQAEAARLAIARALVVYDQKLKRVFEDYDRLLLVADVRRKESRKPGTHSKARAKSQKSYR